MKALVRLCDASILFVQRWISALSRGLLGSQTYALVVKTENGLFAIAPDDFGVGRHLRASGKYGYQELRILRQVVSAGSRVLVVGAHVGALAIPIARLCREVVAIEANPQTFELLQLSIALNNVPNCLAVNVAASDRAEKIAFLLARANSGGSKREPRVKRFAYYYDRPQTVEIDAVSLDTHFVDRHFDVIVMDIEGSEYFALKGMQEILQCCRVLMVEFVPHHLRDVAGVTVEQFLEPIARHFSNMRIPSKQIVSARPAEFLAHLQAMYDRDESDDGVVFEKV